MRRLWAYLREPPSVEVPGPIFCAWLTLTLGLIVDRLVLRCA